MRWSEFSNHRQFFKSVKISTKFGTKVSVYFEGKIIHHFDQQPILKVLLLVLGWHPAVELNIVFNLILESWRLKLVSLNFELKPEVDSWNRKWVLKGFFPGHVNPETLEMLDEEEIKMKESLVEEWFIYRIYNFEKLSENFPETFEIFLPKKFQKNFFRKGFGENFLRQILREFRIFVILCLFLLRTLSWSNGEYTALYLSCFETAPPSGII